MHPSNEMKESAFKSMHSEPIRNRIVSTPILSEIAMHRIYVEKSPSANILFVLTTNWVGNAVLMFLNTFTFMTKVDKTDTNVNGTSK